MVKIISTQGTLGGKKRIVGTRISVDLIGRYVSNGYGVQEIRRDYPHLKSEQISSALRFIEQRAGEERRRLEPTVS